MSGNEKDERDYLFDRAGEADREVERLEGALAPLAHAGAPPRRGRRALWVGLVLALATLAGVFALLPPRQIPSRIAGLFYDDFPGEIGVRGGIRVEFALAPDADPALTDEVAEGLRGRGANVVFTRPGAVLVDLVGVRPERVGAWGRGIGVVGELEIERVASGTERMEEVYAFVDSDPAAESAGVSPEVDIWEHRGQRVTDYYVLAPDRGSLQSYLESLPADLQPEPGFGFRYEETPRGWRSYYAEDRAWISREDVAEAEVQTSEYTALPEILVRLTDEGARRFAELTRRIAGEKLAILLDGEVQSAPLVQEEITGGSFVLSLGEDHPDKAFGEAEGIAAALEGARLPVPVEVASLERVEPVLDGAALLAARGLFALPFGLLVFGLALAVGRLSPAADPEVFPLRGAERAPRRFGRRTLVTLAGLAAPALLAKVPLPGLRAGLAELDLEAGGELGAFALGLGPILAAFLVVELAALAVPRWRRLRIGGPAARYRLDLAVGALAVVLACVQAWFVADWLASLGQPDDAWLSFTLFRLDAPWPRGLASLSLVGGALALGLLAHLVGRYGFGNGYAIVLAGGFVRELWEYSAVLFDAAAGELASSVLGLAAASALVAWALRSRVRGASPLQSFRLPTCGLVPISWASALFLALGGLISLGVPVPGAELLLTGEGLLRPGAFLPITAALALVFSYLFSWPGSLSRTLRVVGDGAGASHQIGPFLRASAVSVALVLALAALSLWAWPQGPASPALLAVAVLVAVALDLTRELRARWRNPGLVRIWPLHRVQLADLAVHALTRQGIDVHARGLHFRTLFFFFAPFVPVTLMVPAERAEEAREILASLLGEY